MRGLPSPRSISVPIHDILQRYDGIAVVGNRRYGSTVVARALCSHIANQGIETVNLDEPLTTYNYLDTLSDGTPLVDYLAKKAIRFGEADTVYLTYLQETKTGLLINQRLNWLLDLMKTRMVVFKIFPADWYGPAGPAITEHVLRNPRIFKLALNRHDVGNALVSYLIGHYFAFWNFFESSVEQEYAKEIVPVKAKVEDIQMYIEDVWFHNNWLWLVRDNIDRMVWFDQIDGMHIPELGITKASLENSRHYVPHTKRAEKYFTNHVDILATAAEIQRTITPQIESIQKRYQHL